MSLNDWLKSGWLKEHKTSKQEITDLFHVADRDLADCETSGLSSDWKLNIAYNAALQLATAALAASGYRADRVAHHYRTIQSLAYTTHSEPELIREFDQFRKKRNIGAYERAGSTSDQEAQEMHELARRLRKEIETWLRKHHPNLL
ncbi:MAG: hypothetical protein V1798_01335 [Pseudomonadota bacterium]